jgi:hypothetical protein
MRFPLFFDASFVSGGEKASTRVAHCTCGEKLGRIAKSPCTSFVKMLGVTLRLIQRTMATIRSSGFKLGTGIAIDALSGTQNIAQAPTLSTAPSRLLHLGTIDVRLRSLWTATTDFYVTATFNRMCSVDRR